MSNGSSENPTQNVTKFLAGGVGSVTAAFGALGSLTGGFERAFRDNQNLSIALLVATAVIVGVGVIAPAVSKKIPDWVLAIGVGLLLGVGTWFAVLIVGGTSTKERPRVSGSLAVTDKQLMIKGLVEASGLKSDEHMLIRVEGRTTKEKLAFFHAGKPRDKADPPGGADVEPGVTDHFQLIYAARVGPDHEGKVKAPIDTVAPAKIYERIVISAQLQEAVNEQRVATTGSPALQGRDPLLGVRPLASSVTPAVRGVASSAALAAFGARTEGCAGVVMFR